MNEGYTEIKEKLDNSKIEYEIIKPTLSSFSEKLKFNIPAGRENNECLLVLTEKHISRALNSEFEKYKFIQGYEAIWSQEKNIVEAEISSPDSKYGNRFFEKLYEYIIKPDEVDDNEEDEEGINEFNLPSYEGMEISIGYSSNEFAVLLGCRNGGFIRFLSRKITIKIKNTTKKTHDSIKELLEKISNSLFFQIDLSFEISLRLQSQRENFKERNLKIKRRHMLIDREATISEPKYEYDNEPISIYWYAKESKSMPIFQFLAFYQTIEFYFPIYSSLDAKLKIQSLIKDPRFNPNRDTDITKIISTIKTSSSGKSFGNEREQLKATIKACIDKSEMKSFFYIDDNRFKFFSENKGKDISKQKISLKNENADLISEISERIYQIRCRIVHSKASADEMEVLLPYSNAINKLNFDIELIEFISRKVLIASSRPISI